MSTLPIRSAGERLAHLCTDILAIAEEPDVGFALAQRLRGLVERALADQGGESAIDRIGRSLAGHVATLLRTEEFVEALGEDVGIHAINELETLSLQGWWEEPLQPAWSGWCWVGEHEKCDGTAPPSPSGCNCPHHRGESLPEFGYRLMYVPRTSSERAAGEGDQR